MWKGCTGKKCPFINRVLVKSAHHQFLPKNNNTSLKFMRINKIIDYQRKNALIFYKILSTNILRKRKRDWSVRRIFFCGPQRLRRSLARSGAVRFACPNRRACSQASGRVLTKLYWDDVKHTSITIVLCKRCLKHHEISPNRPGAPNVNFRKYLFGRWFEV